MTLRVMVVDDTVTYRSIMSKVVESFPQLQLVGTATNGQAALDKMTQSPVDLVFLDVEMPVMDGLATLQAIKQRYPSVCVVFVSAINTSAADTTIKALQMGALDFITKPDEGSLSSNFNELHKRISRVIDAIPAQKPSSSQLVTTRVQSSTLASKTQSSKSAKSTLAGQPSRPLRKKKLNPVDAVVIGVSTGGPNALVEIIPRLKASLQVPVFLVQHMPPVFTRSLADNLNRKSQVTVKEALDGELVQAGFVYVAPGGKHMTLARREGQVLVDIIDTPPENSCKPSVDVLFRSAAQLYGGHVLALVLTGMGNDGQKGVDVLKKAGAYCLTQSRETCVVYGMPRAVDEAGLSDESLALELIADRINQILDGGQP